ncbi:hypothetical protein ACHQM5_004277 [Ranunculus cassubicifolius]
MALRVIGIWRKCQNLNKFGKLVEGINKRSAEISKHKLQYYADVPGTENLSITRRTTPIVDEVIVGFDEEVRELTDSLASQEPERRVMSIVGMGGLGKTTLAKMIYGRQEVKTHFQICVWIYASEEFQLNDLLVSILKQVGGVTSTELAMNHGELQVELHRRLHKKRYFVVIDDIWQVEAWRNISPGFPDDQNGSRVLLTTRNREVALEADPSIPPHELRFLNPDESWRVFCTKVFSVSGSCPPELVDVGKGIVERCSGLPLAIVVLGGLMTAKNKTPDAWSKVFDSVDSELVEDSNRCHKILALSYTDLPVHLKSCFLYVALFPEDSEIDVKKLNLLWVAEGFVDAQPGQRTEVLAEDYFNQLINRSLIQVARRRYHSGPPETCRVHDLLRDVAISKGRKDRFLDIHGNNYTASSTSRRLSLQPMKATASVKVLSHSTLKLRSLLFFDTSFQIDTWKATFGGIKLLRVLDFEGVHLADDLLPEVWKLIHLQYLGLRKTKLTTLSPSICNLVKLQTLDARRVDINMNIPRGIWKMTELRHLHFQTYIWNGLEDAGTDVLEDLPKNLLTLEISSLIWMQLGKIGLAQACIKFDCLRSLTLRGGLSSYVLQDCFPSSLIELNLEGCSLRNDPSQVLGILPNLNELRVRCASYIGKVLHFSANGFPQLQFLELHELTMEEWTVENGSMASLKHLVITDCQRLKMLPDGLRYIARLKEIEISKMPQDFRDRIVINSGLDWDKILHVPIIVCTP